MLHRWHIALACALSALSLFLFAPTAQAQNQPLPGYPIPNNRPATAPPAANPLTTPSGLAATIRNSEQSQNADALLYAYGQAVTNANLARAALSQLLTNYYTLRNQAQTAEQATQAVSEANLRFSVLQAAQNQVLVQQNQQLIQQNQQIINLLQRLVQGRTIPAVPAR